MANLGGPERVPAPASRAGQLAKAALRRRITDQARHTFASNALAAGEAPAWGAAMPVHAAPQMLFEVYARYIPNRARRDGGAFTERLA
jgi:integrase